MAIKRTTFDQILLQGVRKGMMPARTQEAREWFRRKAKESTVKAPKLIREDPDRLRNNAVLGNLYFFYYDPKHKATLPYYDRFPLIFVLERYDDGFLGINLHYLPPQLRAKLMDALYDVTNNKRFDESTKLRATYQVLKSAAKFRYFKPCIKRYLTSHVRSRFIRVYAAEWDIAMMLPVAIWEKQKAQQVWADSRRKINENS